MFRFALWSAGLLASLAMVFAALGSTTGTCIDSSDPAASVCSSQGSPGLLLVGVAAVVLSTSMLWRAHRSRGRSASARSRDRPHRD